MTELEETLHQGIRDARKRDSDAPVHVHPDDLETLLNASGAGGALHLAEDGTTSDYVLDEGSVWIEAGGHLVYLIDQGNRRLKVRIFRGKDALADSVAELELEAS